MLKFCVHVLLKSWCEVRNLKKLVAFRINLIAFLLNISYCSGIIPKNLISCLKLIFSLPSDDGTMLILNRSITITLTAFPVSAFLILFLIKRIYQFSSAAIYIWSRVFISPPPQLSLNSKNRFYDHHAFKDVIHHRCFLMCIFSVWYIGLPSFAFTH